MDAETYQTGLFFLYTVIAVAAVASTAVSYFLLRRESEPHVVVYTKQDKDRPSLLLLIIENVGNGMAYDVDFELSRSIPMWAPGLTPTGATKDLEPMHEGPLIDGIPALAPGNDRVINWGQYGGLLDALEGESVKVVSRFKSKRPYLLGPKEREVESILEVRSYKKTDAASSPERNAVKALDSIADGIEDIADVIKAPQVKARVERALESREQEGEDGETESS